MTLLSMKLNWLKENESKAAKLFAARRLRSEKYSQCGWGTCTEDSETEFFHSDSEESELDFTDTDVPGKKTAKSIWNSSVFQSERVQVWSFTEEIVV